MPGRAGPHGNSPRREWVRMVTREGADPLHG